jgi:predicted HAD superfamily hydrolase
VSAQMGIVETEIAYEVIIREIYNRLNETQVLNAKAVNFSSFLDKSLEADYNSEANVQYLNKDVIAVLRHLKDKGYIIYCVSDFYSDESFIKRLMRKHGVLDLYDKVYVSASENASKENNGLLFSQILKSNQIDPNQAFMIGDNFKSDFVNAKMHGLRAYHLKSFQNKIKQKAQFAQLTARILFSS